MVKEKQIPNKMYFRIGEVAEIIGVKPYVLRYWETEFPDIKPSKSKSDQRLYKRRDVETLVMIKHLLYDEKFTISGARDHLKGTLKASRGTESADTSPAAAAPVQAANNQPAKKQAVETKKILAKIKNDLEWCLSEIRK